MGKAKVFEEILDFAKEKLEGKDERKLIKKVKMKPEWIKLHKEACEAADESRKLFKKAEAIGNEQWSKIKRDLGYPSKVDLSISEDGKELLMYEA